MTIRNLECLFNPVSVALIGASPEPNSVGRTITDNLLNGSFQGPIRLVNPRHRRIGHARCYPSIEALPDVPDLAVIATPPATVPELIDRVGRHGTRAAVVITAGINQPLRQAMLDASRPYCLRIVGPNCLGVWVPRLGLNASFGHVAPEPGRLAFLSQSGALAGAILDWAASRHIGFSAVVSMGDMANVDIGDLLDFLATDISTHAILLYLETIPAARKFMSAARSAARSKPVVVIKSGRNEAAARAAATHTGALAGADDVVDAAFRRDGLLRVSDLEELFTAAETLTRLEPIDGNSLMILTNGGGAGVLAVDELMALGGRLAPLSETALARLDAVLPANWSRANPVDIIGDATPQRYRQALDILLDHADASAILLMNCPTALTSSTAAAQAVVDVLTENRQRGPALPLLCNWLGGSGVVEANRLFAAAGVPSYESPADAVRGFKYLWDYTRAQETLARTPPGEADMSSIDRAAGLEAMRAAAEAKRPMLTEPEAKALLAAYRIATVTTSIAKTPEEVEEVAGPMLCDGEALVVKVLSEDISHKSDVGGGRTPLRGVHRQARSPGRPVSVSVPDQAVLPPHGGPLHPDRLRAGHGLRGSRPEPDRAPRHRPAGGRSRLSAGRIRHHRSQRPQGPWARAGTDAAPDPLRDGRGPRWTLRRHSEGQCPHAVNVSGAWIHDPIRSRRRVALPCGSGPQARFSSAYWSEPRRPFNGGGTVVKCLPIQIVGLPHPCLHASVALARVWKMSSACGIRLIHIKACDLMARHFPRER